MVNFVIKYSGGSTPIHKFHLFVIANHKEVFFSQLGYMGDRDISGTGMLYSIPYPYVKIFIKRAPDGLSGHQKSYSFYIELIADPLANLITIRHPDNPSLIFQSRGRFLLNSEAIALLTPGDVSVKYLKVSRRPPTEELKKMITIERPKLPFPKGRKLNFLNKKKGSKEDG